jgi:glycerol-3-phosphate cytidylyltransferase
MTTVMCYGTWAFNHHGHANLLIRAREIADTLIVAVSTDLFNKVKGKGTIEKYAVRASKVAKLDYVDLVIPEDSWEQKVEDIHKYGVDYVVMGDDWRGEFDDLPCKVIYLSRTPGVSSTQIREEIRNGN